VCPTCNGSEIGPAEVRSAFFHHDRLVVIEDIPALVCAGCNEQFFDDHTVVVLDLLRGDDFPMERARREISVPVFSFRDRAETPAEATGTET
jgi:YgiT-type zinc finger domain-containing protein